MGALRFLLLWGAAAIPAAAIIDGFEHLQVDFADATKAAGLATWSPAEHLDLTAAGIGWNGPPNAIRDIRIRTKPHGAGLSWRPPSSVSLRVEVSPLPALVRHGPNQVSAPHSGWLYVRHSPDCRHWSGWQALQLQTDEKQPERRIFTGRIGVPRLERADYEKARIDFARSGAPWAFDEEALVKSLVARDPDYFGKAIAFVGWVEFLYETSLPGGVRIQRLDVSLSYAVSGMMSETGDPEAFREWEKTTGRWRFKAP